MAQRKLFVWIARLIGVRPEEGRRTVLAMLFYFFFHIHVVLVKSASNALYLKRHDPSYLPVLYILVACGVGILVVLSARLLADPRKRHVRLWSLVVSQITLVVCWALLRFDLLQVSPFLYLFGEVAATALNIQFWSVAGDIFDPLEGKRVFGILAAGGMTGSIFGGLLVRHGVGFVGTVNLLPIAAGALAVCTWLAWRLARHPGRTDTMPPCEDLPLSEGFRYVWKDKFPRTFGLVMLLSAVLMAFVDFFFRTSAQARLGEDELAKLFGELNFYVGAISVVFLFVLSARLLRWAGLFNYLMIIPTVMACLCTGSILFPSFLLVYLLKIVENAGSYSINQAGFQLLYNPVPTLLRAPVRGVVDGFVRKMGFAVGGVLLLVLAPFLKHPIFELVIGAMVLGFMALVVRLRALYIHSLDAKIRVGASGAPDVRLEDASTQKVLLEAIRAGNEETRLTALKFLSDLPQVDIKADIQRLLQSPTEKVQIAAIEAIAQRGYTELLFDLLEIIQRGSRRCRVAAIRAVVRLNPQRALSALGPFLHTEDPGLVAAAIEGMIQVQGYLPDNPAIHVLDGLLGQGDQAAPGVRRETARLLGRLGDGPYTKKLCLYLTDPDASVRRIAAGSARLIYHPEFVPLLLRMLLGRDTRAEAREALAAYGDRVIDVLEEWLNYRERPIEVRLRLPRLLRLIGTQRAGEVLLFSNIQDEAILRYRIALALSGIRLQHPEVRFDRKWALQAVDRRLEAYRYYEGIFDNLVRYLPPRSLVIRVLRDRLAQNIEVAFRVLGLVYPHSTLMNIHHRLMGADGEAWLDAMELLDNLVDRDIRARLFPILENHRALLAITPAMPWKGALPQIRDTVVELSDSRDLLLRAATIHTRCTLGENCASLYPQLFKGKDTMNILEKVLFLESVDIFKKNNTDDLTALAAITREHLYKGGEHILREGEPGDALIIITRGQAEISRKGRRILEVGEKGHLGSISLLDQKPHAADALAVSDCEALVINRTDFMDLVADRVELLHGIFLALTDRLRALLAITEEGALADAEEYSDGPTNPI